MTQSVDSDHFATACVDLYRRCSVACVSSSNPSVFPRNDVMWAYPCDVDEKTTQL